MDREAALREQLSRMLDWQDAHLDLKAALDGIPPGDRGRAPEGLPYSPWQLLEHIRITQRDILDFCRNPDYEEMRWPDDYWPAASAPPSDGAWTESVEACLRDLGALRALAANRSIDLLAAIPHGSGQTYLRELLLVADHNAYHLGQLVAVRRLLGNWS